MVSVIVREDVALARQLFVWDYPPDIPFKYSQGNAASSDLDLRTYGGTNAERKVTGSPVFERTFGIWTVTGPIPVGCELVFKPHLATDISRDKVFPSDSC